MNNKYLITIIVPTIEMEFDIYIPNSRKIGTIKKFVLESISELTDNMYSKQMEDVRMIDRNTALEYDNNVYVKDTPIKNGSKLILL